jgi:histidinol-phosphate/aromatic aminotransferase/cobyric acid decarboxylase-like protein
MLATAVLNKYCAENTMQVTVGNGATKLIPELNEASTDVGT